MLLKQMGGISIPLPLSPATKLLMDHAKLTVLAVIQRLAYGHQHKLCRVIWVHFLVWEGRWNRSVPGCRGCLGAFKSLHRNLKTCPVLFCIGALGRCSSRLVYVHPGAVWTLAMAVKLLSNRRSPISLVFCPPFWSSSAHGLLHYPTRCNFQSHHQKKCQADQNALTREMGYGWK